MAKASLKKAAEKIASTTKKALGVKTATTSHKSPLLEKLFYDTVKDIFWAEKHLTKALPKMRKAATTDQLKSAFENHLVQTKEQIVRLEQVFELLGKKAQAKKCDAMEGLVKECEGVIEETEAGSITRDVALIMSAQKIEHYEIASYGSLATLAGVLDLVEIKNLFGQSLQEEKDTDTLLSEIAEHDINYKAEQEGGEAEEDEESSDPA